MSELQNLLNLALSKSYIGKTIIQNTLLPDGRSILFQDLGTQIFRNQKTNYLTFLSNNGIELASIKLKLLSDNLNIKTNQNTCLETEHLNIKGKGIYLDTDILDITSDTTQLVARNLLELTSEEIIEIKSDQLTTVKGKTIELISDDNKIFLDRNGLNVKSNSVFEGDVKFTGSSIFESTSSLVVKNKEGENFEHLFRVEQNNEQANMSLVELKQSNQTGSFIQFEGESVTDKNTGNIILINDSIDTVEDAAFLSIKIKDSNPNGIEPGEYFFKVYKLK